jgi:hypothetical protein
MFEYLGLLVDTLMKIVPGLKGAKERNRHAAIGANLLSFYNDTNRMLGIGYHLVSSMEVYVWRMEGHLATGNDPYALTAGQRMHRELQTQMETLSELHFTFTNIWYQLSPLVDTRSFQQLVILFAHKFSAISTLMEFVEKGFMPLDINYSLEELTTVRIRSTDDIQFWNMQSEPIQALFRYGNELDFVATNVPWEKDILLIIKKYLEVRRPKDQLDIIAQHLELLRQAIIENFELKDVISKVYDRH